MGHGDGRPLVSTARLETIKLLPQIGALARDAALAASTNAVFRYTLPLGMRLLLRLPARFIGSRTNTCPGSQRRDALEDAYVYA